MSGYLQRLFDRAAALPAAATGGLGAPAMLPGSPLARIDQRLGVEGLAADFTFGAGAVEALSGEDGEGGLLDLPPAPLAPRPGREGEGQSSIAANPALPEPRSERSSPQLPAAPLPAPRTASLNEQTSQPQREIAKPIAEPADRTSNRPPPGTEPIAERRSAMRLAEPSPVPAPEAPSEPALRLDGKPLAQEARPVGPELRHKAAGESLRGEDRQLPAERPAAEPAQARQTPSRATRPGISAEAKPLPADSRLQELALPDPIDWREVDRRINAELDRRKAAQAQDQAKTPGKAIGEQPDRTEQDRRAPAMKTAAEASMIGPIEQTSRPRMLFGERLR